MSLILKNVTQLQYVTNKRVICETLTQDSLTDGNTALQSVSLCDFRFV